MIRLLLFAIPAIFIFLFVRELLKYRRQAAENWDKQWEEKKKNFQQEKEISAKEREILKLKEKLQNQKRKEKPDEEDTGFSSN